MFVEMAHKNDTRDTNELELEYLYMSRPHPPHVGCRYKSSAVKLSVCLKSVHLSWLHGSPTLWPVLRARGDRLCGGQSYPPHHANSHAIEPKEMHRKVKYLINRASCPPALLTLLV